MAAYANENCSLMRDTGGDFACAGDCRPHDALCFGGIGRACDVVEGSGLESSEIMIPLGETRKHDDWRGLRCRDYAPEITIRQSVVAEHHAELLCGHKDSRFVEFHAADGVETTPDHCCVNLFMMFFLGRDDQNLIDAGHVLFLSFWGFVENGRNPCGSILPRSGTFFLPRPEEAPSERLISSARSDGRLKQEEHRIKMTYARLYKIEQRTSLENPYLPHGTARKSDIGRDPGLGRAKSFLSPCSYPTP